MNAGAPLHRGRKAADTPPVRGDQIIVHAPFQGLDDGVIGAAPATLIDRIGCEVTGSVADERHSVVQETGGNHLTDLARGAGRTVLPHDFDDSDLRNQMKPSLLAFHRHREPLDLPVTVEASAPKKALDALAH